MILIHDNDKDKSCRLSTTSGPDPEADPHQYTLSHQQRGTSIIQHFTLCKQHEIQNQHVKFHYLPTAGDDFTDNQDQSKGLEYILFG